MYILSDADRTGVGRAFVLHSAASASLYGQPLGEGSITVMEFQALDTDACRQQTACYSDGDQVIQGKTSFATITPQCIVKVPANRTKVIASSI